MFAYNFLDAIEIYSREAQILKMQGVNIIFALGHSGYEVDMNIARNCPLIDAVIGGHSHSVLYTGEQPANIHEIIDGPYPTMVVQANGHKRVPVVQAYAFTKYMGKLHLTVNMIYQLQMNILHVYYLYTK